MKQVTVTAGQTIYDITTRHYGCFEGIRLLMEDNPGFGLSTELVAGQVVNVRYPVPALTKTNQAVVRQFESKNISVNSTYKYIPNGNCYVAPGYVNPGYVGCETGGNNYVNPGYVNPGYLN
ncbi:MAG: hypothetical protein K1X81_01835 [Bacteroidia bacterium]|nr:hypothetical protein [Bacteroidia bacterium]